jgi:predicted DNA-binding protein
MMSYMAFSLRLDDKTEAAIRRLARETGRSRSAVVRDAMSQYLGVAREVAFARTALDRLRPFVGVTSTDRQLSHDTHTKFKAAMARKHRAVRSR